MNPWTMLASVLQQLPAPARRTLYTLVTAAGAVLAVAQLAGWRTFLGLDVETAMQVYALVASPTGVLALANTDAARDRSAVVTDFGGGGPLAAFDGWDAWKGFGGLVDGDGEEFTEVDLAVFESVDETVDDEERAFS